MKQMWQRVGLMLGALFMLLAPTIAHAQSPAIEFKIAFEGGQYNIYMRSSNVTTNLTLTGQFTLKVPHAVGADRFVVNTPTTPIMGTLWQSSGREDAPIEATGFDYISYSLQFPTGDFQAIPWSNNQEFLVFSFTNSGTCQGPIELIDNASDPFMPPNSRNANVGNSLSLSPGGETYTGRYDVGSADCIDSDGDGVSDSQEDIDGDGNPANDDTDGDGTPNYLDTDDDNDGIPSLTEGPTTDSDGDGIPDRLEPNDVDTDGDGLFNHLDDDDDGDQATEGNTAAEDLNGNGNWFDDDADNDGIPAFLDPNDATAGPGDADGDGITDDLECPGGPVCPDTDGDGIPNYMDVDDDNDGIDTANEEPQSADGNPANDDSDGDGVPDYLEPNDADTDGDGTPNHQDNNDDGDATNTTGEVGAGGPLDPDDSDGDGIPDYLDNDDSGTPGGNGGDSDGDGVPDVDECPGGIPCPDTDGDGIPNYMDTDDDGDGILTANEEPQSADGNPANDDSDGDRVPDYLEPNNVDTDGDGTPNHQDNNDDGDATNTTGEVGTGGPLDPDDSDGDGIPDYLDNDDGGTPGGNGGDSDGDGVPDVDECPGGIPCPDTDGDGIPNYMDTDDDGDGILTANEEPQSADGNPANDDSDGDGVPDYLEPNDADTDGDGTPNHQDNNDDGDATNTTGEVGTGGPLNPDDSDGDDIPDYLDNDDSGTPGGNGGDSDGDGVPDVDECPGGIPCPDTDGDGIPNYMDTDDDGDGILTANEEPQSADGNPANDDSDGDGVPDYLEPNDADTDGDGTPNHQDNNDDGDATNTNGEVGAGGPLNPDDTDGDGIPDYLDNDDSGTPGGNGGDSDGDGVPDVDECPGGIPCPDTDGDGIPNYMDTDDDGDGILTADEDSDTDGDGNPNTHPTDTDNDGVPDYLEPNDVDTDGDNTPNYQDNNDDDDSTNTNGELGTGGPLNPTDADNDNIPDYLDADTGTTDGSGGDSDNDGVPDVDECPGGIPCPDTDGDGTPNYMDTDDDGDGILTANEEPQSADGNPANDDSDGDGVPDYLEPNNADTDGNGTPNHQDNNDDGDATNTTGELGAGGPLDPTDADGDNIPDYLDPDDGTTDGSGGDSDGDGTSDVDECPNGLPCPDSDGDGTPDYNDVDNLLAIKVFLAGAYDTTADLMRDDLRGLSLLPTASPYLGAPGTVNASVFAGAGNNAIVDWVMVELRDSGDASSVVATQAGLVQRDGDVVALDGTSGLEFGNNSGAFYVAVHHRNHLGVMTATPVTLSPTANVDFTSGTGIFGTNAQVLLEAGIYGLWTGDANDDGSVIAAGPGNDVNQTLIRVLSAPGNANLSANYIVDGYATSDLNMDGRTIAAGPGNDVNIILATVFSHPGNGNLAANYIVNEQLPATP